MKSRAILTALALCLTLILAPAAFAADAPSLETFTVTSLQEANVDFVRIPGPATFANVGDTAEAFGAVRLATTTIADGKQLRGDTPILAGTFINTSNGPVDLLGADGGVVRLHPGDIGVIEQIAAGCTVSCGSGYFACCKSAGFFVESCKCRTTGSSTSGCDSGGAGATSCGVDLAEAMQFGQDPIFE